MIKSMNKPEGPSHPTEASWTGMDEGQRHQKTEIGLFLAVFYQIMPESHFKGSETG